MTDEHPANSPEQDITSERDELNLEADSHESEDELDPATSRQTEEAQDEDEDEFEEEGEPGDFDEDEEEEDEDEELESVAPSRPAPKLERLQKILAQAGIASRRHAEELITEGRVQVNGQVVTVLGSKADPARDHIRVDGKLLQGAERLRYFMLNKPKGYVTTVSDPEGRPTIMEFFTKMGERLYPVGRLDYLSEGLLLVTNDGELANGLTKAASGVEKTYLVKVAGQPDEDELDRLREGGVAIERGRAGDGEGKVRTAPARIRQVRQGDNPWYEVVLIEGRNRELRKMFEEIGHHVEKIRRVGYGPLVLDLEPGKLRELDPEEVSALRLAVEGKLKPRRIKSSGMLPKEAGRSAEDRERGFRSRPPRGDKAAPPRTGSRQWGDKPFKRDDRPRQSNRGAEGEGYGGRREGRAPSRWQDRGADRQQGRPFRRESGFGDRPQGERPQGDRPAPRAGRFAARPGAPADRSSSTGRRFGAPSDRPSSTGGRSGGQRPYRSGPPTGEFRPPRADRPYSDRPPRPPRREEGFQGEERPRRQFRPRTERPGFERSGFERQGTEERESRGFQRRTGPPAGRGFERPQGGDRERRSFDRPPRREGGAPAWRGKARPASEGRERPSTGGRSKPAYGSKPPRSGERTGERPSGFRPKSGPGGRPSNGAKRGGKRPGGPPKGRGRG